MKNKGINATAHIQNILHGDTLYNIKKKKQKRFMHIYSAYVKHYAEYNS